MNTYFQNLLATINASVRSIDANCFDRLIESCIDTLRSGHKIVISGLGKNVPICEKFVGTMVSLGLDAQFLHTNSAVHGDMGVVKDGDLTIILTKSGETQESIYLSRKLRDRQTIQWLLTFEETSTLSREIENRLVITLDHEGDLWNILPNNSTTLNLIVLQAVAMQIAERMNLSLQDFQRNHPGGHIGAILESGEL